VWRISGPLTSLNSGAVLTQLVSSNYAANRAWQVGTFGVEEAEIIGGGTGPNMLFRPVWMVEICLDEFHPAG